jgi:hypothetical protein
MVLNYLILARYPRYFLHEWKLVSTYYFNKYDLSITDIHSTGFDVGFLLDKIARLDLYKKRRDPTFDFMNIGGEDFDKNKIYP